MITHPVWLTLKQTEAWLTTVALAPSRIFFNGFDGGYTGVHRTDAGCPRTLQDRGFGPFFFDFFFQSCGHCWIFFQICWQIECSIFTASSFRIWNRSAGIVSPPLTLFVWMLPKAHLTLHSRLSASRWVITPSWLSGSLKIFLYNFSVYSSTSS